MTTTDDGGPAFPQSEVPKLGYEAPAEGMSLRDYVATKALAAMIGKDNKDGKHCCANGVPLLAKYAYEYADALLAARKQP
jgi:hypothetical protein